MSHFQALRIINNHFRFTAARNAKGNAKGSEGKKAEEKESKRAIKHSEQPMAKKSKFWLMRMHQIKISYIFVPNLRELYLFGFKQN